MFRFLILLITLITSCTMAPNRINIGEDIPQKFFDRDYKVEKKAIGGKQWWRKFKDPNLNSFIDSVITRNLDLKIAIKRLNSVEALFDIKKGGQYPSIAAGFSGSKSRGPVPTMKLTQLGPVIGKERKTTESYSFRTGLSYELDIWGKIRSQKKGAYEVLLSSKSDLKTVYLSIISSAITLYYDYQYLNREIVDSRRSLTLLERVERYSKIRYSKGVITKSVYDLVINNRNLLKVKILNLESGLEKLKNGIAILLGEYNLSFFRSSDNFSFPLSDLNIKTIDLSSDILKNRSDIVSAYHKMESIRYEIGAAKADLFPSIKLSFDLLSSVERIEDLFNYDNLTTSMGGNFSQILFAGGSKLANLNRIEANYYQAVLNYRKSIIVGFNDIKNSIIDLESASNNYKILKENYDLAEKNMKRAKNQYKEGIITYSKLLEIEQDYLEKEISLYTAEKGIIQSYIKLNRSLGGNWI